MADKALPGMEFANWTAVPSISETFAKAATGQFNPLMYAAGYALDQLGGSSEMSQKMMGNAVAPPPAPTAPSLGQGLSMQTQQGIAPNSGFGLAAPSQNMFNYTPQSNVMSQQPLSQTGTTPQPEIHPLDAWKTLSFNSFNRGQ
jgi:hypothetical protein